MEVSRMRALFNPIMDVKHSGGFTQDMEAQAKAKLNKKAHSAVILCLGNKVQREVTGETTAAGVWSKLETLYMTKSLATKLYLKKKLYTFSMPAGRKISEHIDEFNKIVLDLANIEVKLRMKILLYYYSLFYQHHMNTLWIPCSMDGKLLTFGRTYGPPLQIQRKSSETFLRRRDDGEGLYGCRKNRS
ncbi:hypothetical protein Tco_1113389 [Tanacetum coccineum]|uniref:Retrovirus-related Pol polyprotein from transposon TNT 1-94 n=1 Tax=Tanacetum coccineum TaxID=301880 RepID=A0ABQ5IT86_9ASTR